MKLASLVAAAAAFVAASLFTVAEPAFADVRASTNGKCPSGYTPYTRKNGDAMCKSPEKEEKKK